MLQISLSGVLGMITMSGHFPFLRLSDEYLFYNEASWLVGDWYVGVE